MNHSSQNRKKISFYLLANFAISANSVIENSSFSEISNAASSLKNKLVGNETPYRKEYCVWK